MDAVEIVQLVQDLIVKVPIWIDALAEFVGYVAGIATVVVRVTPRKDDDKKVSDAIKKVYAVMDRLPTLGINPATQRLKDGKVKRKSSRR